MWRQLRIGQAVAPCKQSIRVEYSAAGFGKSKTADHKYTLRQLLHSNVFRGVRLTDLYLLCHFWQRTLKSAAVGLAARLTKVAVRRIPFGHAPGADTDAESR